MNKPLTHENQLLATPFQYWEQGIHYITIPTMERARFLLGPSCEKTRKRRSEIFYRGIEARQRLPQGMHDRGEEYVWADGMIHQKDKEGLANHFPLHVKVIRYPFKELQSNEIWDVSVRHQQWSDLDYMEELYTAVFIDLLVLNPGSKILVQGNVFTLDIKCLERVGTTDSGTTISEGNCEIAILPTPFSVDRQVSPHKGENGKRGIDGKPGNDGRSAMISGTMLGPVMDQMDINTDGANGKPGHPGFNGQRGQNGGMTKLADIRIGNLKGFDTTQLKIFTRPGAGEPGGKGGDGGNGGKGGNGGDGAIATNGIVKSGKGGSGGNGGNGGNGGKGGSGGLSSNIFISVPIKDLAKVKTLTSPGHGGEGGKGGRPGYPGFCGSIGKMKSTKAEIVKAEDGSNGKPGKPGKAGINGKSRPAANVFVFPFFE